MKMMCLKTFRLLYMDNYERGGVLKELPVRKNHRLGGYDYSNTGAYYITICVKNRHDILWEEKPVGAAFGRPPLSEIGALIDIEIKKIEGIYDCVRIDNYVIMPNHVHMIISLLPSQDTDGRP